MSTSSSSSPKPEEASLTHMLRGDSKGIQGIGGLGDVFHLMSSFSDASPGEVHGRDAVTYITQVRALWKR